MMKKTIEELEKELSNTKSKLSYYKNRNGHKPKGRAKKRASTLLKNQEWNDAKRAMATVIARLTASTEEEFKKVRDEAYAMSITEVKELAKGHEKEVAEELIARQERRNAKTAEKEAMIKMVDEWSSPDTPAPIPVREAIPKISRRQQMTDKEIEKLHQREKYVAPQKRWGGGQLTADESSVEAIVHVKASTLRLAVAAVESNTGFDGLSKDQVVGHILSRYLQDNS